MIVGFDLSEGWCFRLVEVVGFKHDCYKGWGC